MKEQINGFWLSPSYACNNRCRWCYAGEKVVLGEESSLADLKKYISMLAKAGAKRCILVGGEPSIYPNILGLIRFATDCGIEVRMMSNGRKLADANFVCQLLDAGLAYVSISLEGTEAIHDNVTRIRGSFKESVQGVINCQAAGMPVNTITTIGTYNIGNIVEFAEFLNDLRLRRAVFNMCSSQPSGFCTNIDDGVVELEDYAMVVESIGLQYEFVRFYALIPLCLFDQEKLHRLIELGRLNIACSLFSNAVAIDPKGNLLPCTHMAGVSYGNLNDAGALESFIEKKEAEIEFLKTHAPSDKCVNCELWTTCLGGCNLIWFSRDARKCICGIRNKEAVP